MNTLAATAGVTALMAALLTAGRRPPTEADPAPGRQTSRSRPAQAR